MRFVELFAGIGGFRYGLERCMGIESADEKSEQTKPKYSTWGRICYGSIIRRSAFQQQAEAVSG